MSAHVKMRELGEAVQRLVDIYFDAVPVAEVDREDLAECIADGLSDELATRPSRAAVLTEAAEVAHAEGERLYDEADVEEAKAAWSVEILLRRMAAEAGGDRG